MSEKEFKKWLTMNAPKDWMLQTIETSTGTGVPDLFFCVHGYQGWIELKSSSHNSKCYIRISQWRWLCKLVSRGGFALLLIKREKLKKVDVYLARDLVKYKELGADLPQLLKGSDIVFPSNIKPVFSYKLGTGNQVIYKGLIEIMEDEY